MRQVAAHELCAKPKELRGRRDRQGISRTAKRMVKTAGGEERVLRLRTGSEQRLWRWLRGEKASVDPRQIRVKKQIEDLFMERSNYQVVMLSVGSVGGSERRKVEGVLRKGEETRQRSGAGRWPNGAPRQTTTRRAGRGGAPVRNCLEYTVGC